MVYRTGDNIPTPLSLYRAAVRPEWIDYNGHMTEAAYLTAAGDASDALFRYVGIDDAYRAAGHSLYTVETHIHFVRELSLGEPIACTTQILGADRKRVHLIHMLVHGETRTLVASVEQMLVHVDMAAGRSAPLLEAPAAAFAAIADAHASMDHPHQVGSVMRIPPTSTTP